MCCYNIHIINKKHLIVNRQTRKEWDLLAVFVAFVWAYYSILTRKISYPVILTTGRTFFYGILFMVSALLLFNFEMGLERFADVTYLLNILYLGLWASALCLVTWNLAVKLLGAVRISVYFPLWGRFWWLKGLSLPLLSEKSGGEILLKRGIENGFAE